MGIFSSGKAGYAKTKFFVATKIVTGSGRFMISIHGRFSSQIAGLVNGSLSNCDHGSVGVRYVYRYNSINPIFHLLIGYFQRFK
jgi:hypothetical protein